MGFGTIKKAVALLLALMLALAAFPAGAQSGEDGAGNCSTCNCGTCCRNSATGGNNAATGGDMLATGGDMPATGGDMPATGGDKSPDDTASYGNGEGPEGPSGQGPSGGGGGARPAAIHTLRKGNGYYDTLLGAAIEARVYSASPVMACTTGAEAESVRAAFGKGFPNKIRVVHFDKTGKFEPPVRVAAKVGLAGMDTAGLFFYAYDSANNKYSPIKAPVYSVDRYGYLHFTAFFAGDIIVSEGPLGR